MSARDNETLGTPAAADEIIWPTRVAVLRPLTKGELERLEAVLAKSVDRKHLEHWVTTSISNAVKLASRPSAQQARDGLKKLASEGRKWLDQVDSDPIKALVEQKVLQDHQHRPDALLEHGTALQIVGNISARACGAAGMRNCETADRGRSIRRKSIPRKP